MGNKFSASIATGIKNNCDNTLSDDSHKKILITLFGNNQATSIYFNYFCNLVGTPSVVGVDLTVLHLETNTGKYKIVLRHVLTSSYHTLPCYFTNSDCAIAIYESDEHANPILEKGIRNAIKTHKNTTGNPCVLICNIDTRQFTQEVLNNRKISDYVDINLKQQNNLLKPLEAAINKINGDPTTVILKVTNSMLRRTA